MVSAPQNDKIEVMVMESPEGRKHVNMQITCKNAKVNGVLASGKALHGLGTLEKNVHNFGCGDP